MRLSFLSSTLACAGAAGTAVLLATSLVQPRPVAAFVDNKAAGAEVFSTSGCAHCHGVNGEGTEKGPNLHNLRRKTTAEKIREQIVHGGGAMPAFGEALQPEQITQLVEFLRAKKWTTPPQPKPDGAAPPASTPPPAP